MAWLIGTTNSPGPSAKSGGVAVGMRSSLQAMFGTWSGTRPREHDDRACTHTPALRDLRPNDIAAAIAKNAKLDHEE